MLVQLPTDPCAGGVDASHQGRTHRAARKVPATHLEGPEGTYPELHTIWHVAPEASIPLQLPTTPFEGRATADVLHLQLLFPAHTATSARV